MVRVGIHHAREHLIDHRIRVIDQLLHDT
jgi:hypothetical protein